MSRNRVADRFTKFFDTWVDQLEDYLSQLLTALTTTPTNPELEALVSKLTQHHKEYYKVKWGLAKEDSLPFFSQTWSTPLEKAYSWLTGWKPTTMLKMVPQPTQQQSASIDELRLRLRVEEEKVERAMERQHVALADKKFVQLARLATCHCASGDNVAVALNEVADGLEKIMKMADCVRLRALKGILEILSPLQGVVFLAASSMLLVRLREFGRMRLMIGVNGRD
ncbi:Protein DOG1-like 4 [Linum perenne]